MKKNVFKKIQWLRVLEVLSQITCEWDSQFTSKVPQLISHQQYYMGILFWNTTMSFKSQSPVYTILVCKVRHAQSQSQGPSRPILCPKRPSFHQSKRFRKGTRGFHRQCIHTKHRQKFSQNQLSFTMKYRSNQSVQTYVSNH